MCVADGVVCYTYATDHTHHVCGRWCRVLHRRHSPWLTPWLIPWLTAGIPLGIVCESDSPGSTAEFQGPTQPCKDGASWTGCGSDSPFQHGQGRVSSAHMTMGACIPRMQPASDWWLGGSSPGCAPRRVGCAGDLLGQKATAAWQHLPGTNPRRQLPGPDAERRRPAAAVRLLTRPCGTFVHARSPCPALALFCWSPLPGTNQQKTQMLLIFLEASV